MATTAPVVPLNSLMPGIPPQQQPQQVTPAGTIDASTGLATGAGPSQTPPTQQPGISPGQTSPYQQLSLPAVDPGQGVQLAPDEQQGRIGTASTAGRVAFVADKILRGAIAGRQQAQLAKAQQFNRTLNAQQGIYNDQAKQYQDLVASGADPNSPEVQSAHARTLASWQSMMDTVGKQIPQPKIDPKTGQPKGDQRSILQRMFDQQDPNAALAAWYQGAQKLGPPVFHQTAPMLTPSYQAKAQQQAQTQGTQAATAQATAENQQRIQQLTAKPDLTQDEQDELYRLKYGVSSKGGAALPPGVALKPLTGAKPVLGADGKTWSMPMVNTFGQTVLKPLPEGFLPPPAMMKGVQRIDTTPTGQWYSYDVDQRGQEIPNTRKPLSAAAMAPGSTTSTAQIQTHVNPDGTTYQTRNQTSSEKQVAGGGAAKVSAAIQAVPLHGAGQAGENPAPGVEAAPIAPSHARGRDRAAEAAAARAAGTGAGTGAPAAAASVPAASTSSTPGLVAGTPQPKPVGPEAKAITNYGDATKLVSLAQQALASPNGSSQYLLMDQLVHGALGRANQTALQNIMGTAGWGASTDTWLQRAKNGEMSPKLVQQLAQYTQQNLKATDAALRAVRGQTGGVTPAAATTAPATHVFSVSAWQKANPRGDAAAARAAAEAAHYQVVP